MRSPRFLALALIGAMSIASLVPALAQNTQPNADPQQITGSVRLDLEHVVSMAQLQQILEHQGYSSILLSPVKPNVADPRPDLEASDAATSRLNPALTPAHTGWNGTAVRKGKRVSVILG
jgi:hypothetical protein